MKNNMGAVIQYCGHDGTFVAGTFVADVFEIEGAVVVKANGPVTMENLTRPAVGATHYLSDFPSAGCWCPARGFFVVPKKQLRNL